MRHLDPVAPLDPRQRGADMLVVDALEAKLVARLVLLDRQARILLDNPRQRARQFDVVLAVGGLDRHRAIARRKRRPRSAAEGRRATAIARS